VSAWSDALDESKRCAQFGILADQCGARRSSSYRLPLMAIARGV
jgi:hypothetical protein